MSRWLYLHVARLACAEDTATYRNLRNGRLERGHHEGLHRPSAKPGSLRPALDLVQHRTDRVSEVPVQIETVFDELGELREITRVTAGS